MKKIYKFAIFYNLVTQATFIYNIFNRNFLISLKKNCYTYDTFNNENVKGNNFNLFLTPFNIIRMLIVQSCFITKNNQKRKKRPGYYFENVII